MDTLSYPPDGGTWPECGECMWFVRGTPKPWIGAHDWCRCGRRWHLLEDGTRVPFTGELTGGDTVGKVR